VDYLQKSSMKSVFVEYGFEPSEMPVGAVFNALKQ
jgi:TRAP-type C4-dicarboxylate transport system substrate-binding protein